MRWTTWTLFVAAAALLVGVGAMVSRQSRVTPAEFFEAVEKRIADGRYDREQTLLNLDQVLARAREAGDADLETRVLVRRGRLLMELGAWDRARTDLLAVAERRPGDADVESELVELETRAGDFAAAEARVRRGLELAPESPVAWTRLGRLHRLAAEKNEASALELLGRMLPPDDYAVARAALSRAIALDPNDVARPALAQKLREILRDDDEAVLQEILRFSDRAAEESLRARDGYARALELGLAPEPLAGLLDLFVRAGRSDLAVDLAASTLRVESIQTDPDVGREYLSALEDLGRFRFAGELARPWTKRTTIDADFLSMIARIGLRSDKAELMYDAGWALYGVGNVDQSAAASFYMGLGLARGGAHDGGRNFLRRFVGSASPDPVPGARAMAWRAIAQASRALNEPDVEREALQGAIELEPDFDGEMHLRIADLLMVAPHGGYRLPETRWAKGMSLLPQRTEELLPRWHEIGKRELSSIGFDPEVVRADLLRARLWQPQSDASPYELYRLAQIHHAAHDDARAKTHVDRLLEIVPGFVPALDLSLEIARGQSSRARLLRVVADRVAAGGRTDETTAILREIPIEELVPRDLLDLMRADPEYFGRIAVAQTLAGEGRPRTALALLETIDPAKFGDEARVLSARLNLEAGRPARALELLQPMGRGLVDGPESIELAVRAACWSGASVEARGLLGLVALEKKLGRARRMALADVALRAGEIAPARLVLRAVDGIPAARGGDLCTQIAIAAALAGEKDEVARALARAEAFETKGGLERATLAIAIHAGEIESWKDLAERAATRGPNLDPLTGTALLVLRGRVDDARARIADALSSERPVDARWSVLARALPVEGAQERLEIDARLGGVAAREIDAFVAGFHPSRDPVAAAAWVAQSGTAEGLPLALHALRARSGGGLWSTWLLASLAQRVGDVHGARTGAQAVLAIAPDFRPAWDLREALEPELRTDPVAYGRFRGERLQALGAGAASTLEGRQDRARMLAAGGDHAGALEIANSGAGGDDATSAELSAIAARSLIALGRPREAVERLTSALTAPVPPHDVRGAVGDLLAAVDAAEASSDPLPRNETLRVLMKLAETYDDDPRLALALARMDLELDPRNPVLGVQRAIARLERYRALFAEAGLDASTPGAAAAWIDFLARLDPERALDLAAQELALRPGSLPTWIANARAHEAHGDRARAVDELRLAARISDRGDVSREILRVRSRSDMDATEITATVKTIQALEGRGEPDPALHLLAARSFLNLGPRLTAQVVEHARAARSHPTATEAQRRAARALLAIAMLSRGNAAEQAEAASLLRDLRPERPSRIEEDFLRALRGVARGAQATASN